MAQGPIENPVINVIAGDNQYGETSQSLDRYFLPFALAAQRAKAMPPERRRA